MTTQNLHKQQSFQNSQLRFDFIGVCFRGFKISPWPDLFLIIDLDPDIKTLFSLRNSEAKLLPCNKARGADPEIKEENKVDFPEIMM